MFIGFMLIKKVCIYKDASFDTLSLMFWQMPILEICSAPLVFLYDGHRMPVRCVKWAEQHLLCAGSTHVKKNMS